MNPFRDDELSRLHGEIAALKKERSETLKRVTKLSRELERYEAAARAKPRRRWNIGIVAEPAVLPALVIFGIVLLVGGVVTALVLAAQQHEQRTAGYVVGKHHHSAYTETLCTTNPNTHTTTCMPIHHPERWTLVIDDDGDVARWDVSQGVWEHTAFGSWWERPR